MRVSILISLLVGFSLSSWAQESKESEKKAVQTVIESMFDAMREGDSLKLRKVFHESIRLQTTYTDPKSGIPKIQTGDIENFIKQVGTPHEAVWDERISSYDIRVDDNMASAWTPYEFYAGEKFSHCGVNTFILFKTEAGWKITQIMDTRRRENCK